MRLRLTLQHAPNQVLSINYQYLIASWIYRTLGSADQEFATRLHQHGYDFSGKKYKLFTFSPLQPAWYDIGKQERVFRLVKSPTILELSFHIDEAIQHFVTGLFADQQFTLSSGRLRADFEVANMELLAAPQFKNTMQFQLQTPLCISTKNEREKYAHYCDPQEEGYGRRLINNLLSKQNALNTSVRKEIVESKEPNIPYAFKLLSKPKPKLISIKGTKIKGYLFDFELTVPENLMKLGYFGGFGEKNSSLGFGMVG